MQNGGFAHSAFFKFYIFHFELKKCQGDHGRRRANCRCCLPALAGFVSPHSMGPDKKNSAGLAAGCRAKARLEQKSDDYFVAMRRLLLSLFREHKISNHEKPILICRKTFNLVSLPVRNPERR